ncbi:MAG: hypothetical protein K6F09_02880 [Clostridiales bacterium]|nr:hypothetical protein [Clostridiales bacterium]
MSDKRHDARDLIFGTDWWTDCDDVAALDILLKAHKKGMINLRCVGINSVMEYSAASVDALCESEGVFVPIGVDKSAVRDGNECKYQKALASYSTKKPSISDCPDAYKLYRKALSESKGGAVIVEVGFPQIIAELLRSPPDEISPLDGKSLVSEKVSEIRLMAGRWDTPNGREYNLCAYPVNAEAGSYICENSPVPLVFLGFEVGYEVITGKDLPSEGLVGLSFELKNGSRRGNPSWDPMTALAAVIGDDEKAGYRRVYGKASVDPGTGENNFTEDENGSHCYLIKTMPDEYYATEIDKILKL